MRREPSLIEDLLLAPWWASLVVGGAAYAGLRWGVPYFIPKTTFREGFVLGATSLALPVANFFVLISILSASIGWFRKRHN